MPRWRIGHHSQIAQKAPGQRSLICLVESLKVSEQAMACPA